MATATKARRGRVISEADRARTEERREAFRALAREIGKLSEADRERMAAEMPIVTIEGHALSATNACLAAAQRPDATIVGGYRQWRAAGRQVRRGERAIMIWSPSRRKADPDAGEGEGERIGFVPISVFDVSQTDAIA